MIESLIRLLYTVAPAVSWIAIFAGAVVGLFALYVGFLLVAIVIAPNLDIAKIRYKALREVVDIFRRRRR
jgi:hypothetical protein